MELAETAPPEVFEARLAATLRRALGQPVEELRAERLSGGASQETSLVKARVAGIEQLFILRRAPGGMAEPRAFAAGLPAEAAVMARARAQGVPVAQVLVVLEPEDGLGRGFLMRHVAGEAIARKILRDARFAVARPKLARQCGEILAAIHAIPPAECPALRTLAPRERLSELQEQYRRQDAPRPVFEVAFRWLQQRLPEDPAQLTLVHGDFRNGNLMVDEQGVAAVLDWELAHFGDPVEDLGLLCAPTWRFGEIDRMVGGFGDLADLLAGYRTGGGGEVDEQRLRYWVVFNVLFWGVMCVEFALDFRRGDRTVERAAIGRRASEAEIDLLTLFEAWS